MKSFTEILDKRNVEGCGVQAQEKIYLAKLFCWQTIFTDNLLGLDIENIKKIT